jgi:hypothetical protein
MYLHTDKSSLGGSTSTFIRVAVESPEDWNYNIFHNAHYGIFCLRDNKLELISKHFQMPKFRKCKCDSFETAKTKVAQWIATFN